MKIKNIVYAAAATLLAACSNESGINVSEPVALQVNATITNTATRLGYAGKSFVTGTEISLFADGSTTPLTYTAGEDGSSFSSTSGYLFNKEEMVKFTALYPTLETGGEAIPVNTATQSDNLDILFANGKASIFAPELTLKFTHVMSKLTFTLVAGNGFTTQELEDATVTLTGITTDGTFSTTTGTVTAGSTTGNISAVKQQTTAEAIVVPQSATFTLKVTVNNMDYTKRLTASLAAGNNYSYPVTLNKESMTVGTVTIADWTDEEVEDAVSMRYQSPIKTITNKADVQKYDYLMSDGTFLRAPKDDLSYLSNVQKSNIVGVVFWTEKENEDDCPGLNTDKKLPEEYQHGLIVSVKEYLTTWTDVERADYTGTVFDIEKLNGYSNTLAIKSYNETAINKVLAVSVFADEANVANTCGWYLPSPREAIYLLGGTTYDGHKFDGDFTVLNSYLAGIGGEEIHIVDSDNINLYTSAEETYMYYAPNAYILYATNGAFYYNTSSKIEVAYVRPICAF
jgi:hypothetical protein